MKRYIKNELPVHLLERWLYDIVWTDTPSVDAKLWRLSDLREYAAYAGVATYGTRVQIIQRIQSQLRN